MRSGQRRIHLAMMTMRKEMMGTALRMGEDIPRSGDRKYPKVGLEVIITRVMTVHNLAFTARDGATWAMACF